MKKILNLLIVLFVVIIAGWYLAYLLGYTPGKMAESDAAMSADTENISADDSDAYGITSQKNEENDADDKISGTLNSDDSSSKGEELSLDERKISQIADSISSDDNYNGTSLDDSEDEPLLTSAKDLGFHIVDETTGKYAFTYNNETFTAVYTTDNWKIFNSYKINNEKDMTIICQTLIDEHPIHGRDMTSYRTVDDMVYEWLQHNLVYAVLPEDSEWLEHVKDVDLDPKDQNKSFDEIYKDRTGKELSIDDILK